MASDEKSEGSYEVGYGKPPKEHRFQKGRSGNPRGRPKTKKVEELDVSALLEDPVAVKLDGKQREMPPFEISTRQIAKKALEGNTSAMIDFIRLCEQYGILAPKPEDQGGGVIFAPKGMTPEQWLNEVAEWVPADLEEEP